MNKVQLSGRLTKDPEVRTTQGETPMTIARYNLAVDRRTKGNNEQTADFISIVAFGKSGEFADKYLKKGMKIIVTGRIQTGSFKNKEGNTVYTTDVVAEEQEFCEKKTANGNAEASAPQNNTSDVVDDDFVNIPDGIDDELPFDM